MNEGRLKELQEELEQLKARLQMQQDQINHLQDLVQKRVPGRRHLMEKGTQWSMENFIGLRLIHFIGIIVLVIGLSIGVKYAIDQNLISEGLRIALAYLAGLVLYFLSIRLKEKYSLFSAILFSGGMASLYFTTYGAHVYYSMFPSAVAFLIMIILTVFTVFEAIRYNRQEIALLGLVGAYGIPFLISRNADRPELFFLYISLINLGVVFLCIRKSWKRVGRLATGVTWILFLRWASTIKENDILTGLAFMSFFFLLFMAVVLSFRFVHKKQFTINDSYQLVLNNLALFIAALLVFVNGENGDVAFISLMISAVAGVQAFLFHRYLAGESFTTRMIASLSLTFFVVFIAFNWTGFTVTLLWLLTAVIVFAWGFKMRSVPARMTAIVLIGVTLGKLIAFDSLTFSTVQKVIAYLVLGVLLLVVSFFYQKFRKQLFGE